MYKLLEMVSSQLYGLEFKEVIQTDEVVLSRVCTPHGRLREITAKYCSLTSVYILYIFFYYDN